MKIARPRARQGIWTAASSYAAASHASSQVLEYLKALGLKPTSAFALGGGYAAHVQREGRTVLPAA